MSGHRWLARSIALIAASVGLSVVAAVAAAPAHAAVTTLYVGGSGCSDSGSGTQAQPFCTIGRGAALVAAGQTVLVAAGTYPEKVTVTHSGTAAAPIVVTAAPGATVTVPGAADGFVLSGRAYVTIRGFTVVDTTSYGISVSSSSNVTISGNTVTGSGSPASGQTAAGIYLNGTTASTVTGNTSSANSGHGIYLTTTSSNDVVSYNEADRNAEGWRRNANGIDVIGPDNTVIGNVVHDNEDSGLQFYPGGDRGLATLNVSYNNGDHGIDDLNVTGGRLIGNTVYHNCTTGINVEGTSGGYLIENNIAVDNAVYPAYNGISCTRRAGNIGIWDSAPPTTTVDNNLVYLSTTGTMYVFGSSYSTLAAMRAATGQEQHGVQADPRFTAAASGDLTLTGASPAIDAADSAAGGEQATDVLHAARADDPSIADTGRGPRTFDDLGAYEFQSGTGQPQPPTAHLSVTPPTGTAPLPVTADAGGSTDPQGLALSYRFDFGDGVTVGPQSTATAAHTFAGPGTYAVTLTVTDTAGLSATDTTTVTAAGAGGNPVFVSQIATNYSTGTHTSGNITVWRTQGVAAGDLEVATVSLSGVSATGAITGTDSRGNTLAVVRDMADGAGHRLVVLAGIAQTALVPNDRITVTFPSASAYRMTGDEVSGVGTPDVGSGAAGNGTAFGSGATPTTSAPNEFVFGAMAAYAGTAPTWNPGWTAESSYLTGADYLGRAYRTTTAPGSFDASGVTSGQWLAVCVTFR